MTDGIQRHRIRRLAKPFARATTSLPTLLLHITLLAIVMLTVLMSTPLSF